MVAVLLAIQLQTMTISGLAVEDRCTVSKATRMYAKRGGKGARVDLTPGTVVDILQRRRQWVQVKADKATGFVRTKLLSQRCKPLEAEPPAPGPSPSEAVDSAKETEQPTPTPSDEMSSATHSENDARANAADASVSAAAPTDAADATVNAAAPIDAAPSHPKEESTDASHRTPKGKPNDPPSGKEQRSTKERIKVAVMDLTANEGVSAELVAALTTVIPSQLEQMAAFKALSSQDIRQMLAYEGMKQALGCDDIGCLAEIGGAVGADYLVTGRLLAVDTTTMVQIQLINIRTSEPQSRVSREYSGPTKGLFDEMRIATKLLVRDLLSQRSGTLVVRSSEEGATVRLDGTIVGVTPLAPQKAAGGLHTLEIEKTGFVLFGIDVEVEQGRETVVEASLAPSAEYRRAYTNSAKTTRWIAHGLTGFGVAAVAGGLTMFVDARGRSEDLRRDVVAYNQSPATASQDSYKTLVNRRQGVALRDTLALVGWGVAVVSLGLGSALYALGDDPDRFEADLGVEVAVVPTTGASVGSAMTFLLRGEF